MSYHLLHEKYLKLLDHCPAHCPQLRHVPDEKIDFLLTGAELGLFYDLFILIFVDEEDPGRLGYDARVVISLLARELFLSEEVKLIRVL